MLVCTAHFLFASNTLMEYWYISVKILFFFLQEHQLKKYRTVLRDTETRATPPKRATFPLPASATPKSTNPLLKIDVQSEASLACSVLLPSSSDVHSSIQTTLILYSVILFKDVGLKVKSANVLVKTKNLNSFILNFCFNFLFNLFLISFFF